MRSGKMNYRSLVISVVSYLLGASVSLWPVLSLPQVRKVEVSAGTKTAILARGKYNGKLVFSSDRHNGRGLSIWTMNSDGSSPTRLTDGKSRTERLPSFVPVYDFGPVWSPDGTRIALVSNRDYLFAVYIMNADGSNVHLVTDKVQDSASLAWSPDGSRIALSGGIRSVPAIRGTKPSVHIYTINIDGSQLTKLTSDGINDSPAWSPDGKQIAFNSKRDPDGRHKIWLMNADGSNQKRLTDIHGTSNHLFYGDGGPVWSPDGTKILFNGNRDFNGTRNCNIVNCSELFVMNADGSNDVPLTNDPNRVGGYAARWSPDGAKIVASRSLGTIADRRNGIDMPTAIIVMNADGSNPVNLSNRSERFFVDAPVDWQPLSAPSTEPPSSVLSFNAPAFNAYEGSGSVSITVKRSGNLNATASCYYATVDGTATAKYNYSPVFGTLRFAPSEASKTISIPIIDNGDVRGSRSFKIVLSDNEGNATFIGGNKEATVTILDRDNVPRSTNPIDDAQDFVRMHYVDFLNREPDQAGWDYWTNQITRCGSDANCTNSRRIGVSAALRN
jgi:Tol biopolymer transport system component